MKPNELIMQLVDLKSNLNKFKGKFKPDKPYEKTGRKINELESGFFLKVNQIYWTMLIQQPELLSKD